MNQGRHSILRAAGHFVTQLLIAELPADRLFHNIHHTINVVQGVIDIGRKEKVTNEQLEILILSAWFHDTGHIETYEGHEEVSARIAVEWLRQYYPDFAHVETVKRCILATRMPQQPLNLLQAILCDADLYHLSFSSYNHYQTILREEWRRVLDLDFEDDEWEAFNEDFLYNHCYWTRYGREILERQKEIYENGADDS